MNFWSAHTPAPGVCALPTGPMKSTETRSPKLELREGAGAAGVSGIASTKGA
jgi:hypothetical protein